MRPESAKLLSDILQATDRIAKYTHAKGLTEYLSDTLLRDAVHWNFAIIGEALNQLNKTDPTIARRITEWRRIIAFRNQLIHGYGVIKNEITWDIVRSKLHVLRADVSQLLDI